MGRPMRPPVSQSRWHSGSCCWRRRRRWRTRKAPPVPHENPDDRRAPRSWRMRRQTAGAPRLRTDPQLRAGFRDRTSFRPQVSGWKSLGRRFHLHHLYGPLPAHEFPDARGAAGRNSRRAARFVLSGPGARYPRGSGALRGALPCPTGTMAFPDRPAGSARPPRPRRIQIEQRGWQFGAQHAPRVSGPAVANSPLLHYLGRRPGGPGSTRHQAGLSGAIMISIHDLPAINATLNATAAVLLVWGFLLIRRRSIAAHRKVMLAAFATSSVFLCCYLVYHYNVGSVPFPGTGALRTVYLSILATHTALAAAVPPLALITLSRGLRERYDRHRKIARWTLPIWLYVR